MKMLKKFISIFMVMQIVASCSLMGHGIDFEPETSTQVDSKEELQVGQTRPKVSVIVPVYKVEPWIRDV